MIREELITAFASPGFLVIACYFYSYSALMTLRKLSIKKENTDIMLVFAMVVNTVILLLWDNYDKSDRPVLLILIPLIIMFELYWMTNDELWTYLNLFFLTLLDSFCMYGICSAIIALTLGHPWGIGTAEHHRALLTMTFFMSTLIFWGVNYSKAMTVEELSGFLHSRERGVLLFGYVVATSLILLLSAMFSMTLIYDSNLPDNVSRILHMEEFLKDLLILGGSFLIILSQVWEEKRRREISSMDTELKMERQFRENVQEDTLFRFCFDVSLGEIVEGMWFFERTDEEFELDTVSVLDSFRNKCIHAEDRKYFIPLKELSNCQEKLRGPLHVFDARLSSSYLLDQMRLTDSVRNEIGDLNKEWIWCRIQTTIVEDEGSGDILCHLSVYNIDKEISRVESLTIEAKTDVLTGLYNRNAIEESIKTAFEKKEACGALFIVDMDYFKSVNDTLGHPVGDRVLKETADILRSAFRGRDVVARLGGDEFCVFAWNFTDEELVRNRAAELNELGRRRNCSEDGTKCVNTSFSIGVAICEKGWDGSYEELYGRADLALYEAKESGRNTNRLYHPGMER